MLSFSLRSLLVVSLLLSVIVCSHGEPPASKPTAKQIAQWIEQLGDNEFPTRENASKKLWQAGSAAESALEKALKSDDPEVVRRARELLDKFHWGLYPDTPADIVALIRAYKSSVGQPRLEVLQKLLDKGDVGLRALVKIAAAEKDENQRSAVANLVANQLPSAFLKAVTEEKYEPFEHLLEIGHEGKLLGHTHYAAYWLLRGQLAKPIARFASRLRDQPDDKWAAQTLAYLHRANGDLVAARKAADKSDNTTLIEGILYEAADWKALAAYAHAEEKPSSAKDIHRLPGAADTAENWAYRAACARLAGNDKDFEKELQKLRKISAAENASGIPSFLLIKGLLLNDRPADGLDMLRRSKLQTVLFDLLCTRFDYAKALDLPEEPQPASTKMPSDLAFLKARTLHYLGEKEEAKKRFAKLAENIKDEADPRWVANLLSKEYSAGFKELAFEHGARALRVTPRKIMVGANGGPLETVFIARLFPERQAAAELLWLVLSQKFKEDSPAAVLKRQRALMEGKIAAKDAKAWIEAADAWIAASQNSVEGRAAQRQELAEVAFTAGREDLALSLLRLAGSREALVRLGDLFAAKKEWAKAAEHYRQAWSKERKKIPAGQKQVVQPVFLAQVSLDPLPLYLAGDALLHLGQQKEGNKLIEQAHGIPLADSATRYSFFRALDQRGFRLAAEREADLLLKVSEPNAFYGGEALRRLGMAALRRKEYLKAAECFEQSMLRCLRPGLNFISDASYVQVPAQIHQLRAQGLLAAGKLDEAVKQMDLALAVWPSSVALPIALVPELEQRGHKKEANALFERCQATYEKVCRDYPRCAENHNNVAWMMVCCRRHLDRALEHARKAAELAPHNAAYLDTLAEIHFQRGDKDKAIALQKRAIELDSKKSYYRKQLKRLEAGDPSAERPLENEE